MGPGLGAGPLGQPGDGFAHRGGFQGAGEEAISALRSQWLADATVLLAVVLVVMTPARPRRGRYPTRRRSH